LHQNPTGLTALENRWQPRDLADKIRFVIEGTWCYSHERFESGKHQLRVHNFELSFSQTAKQNFYSTNEINSEIINIQICGI
jgi:hypothetical protein